MDENEIKRLIDGNPDVVLRPDVLTAMRQLHEELHKAVKREVAKSGQTEESLANMWLLVNQSASMIGYLLQCIDRLQAAQK